MGSNPKIIKAAPILDTISRALIQKDLKMVVIKAWGPNKKAKVLKKIGILLYKVVRFILSEDSDFNNYRTD